MDGTRVLEFGTYLAGPLAGKHLQNLGCHVTAVQRPRRASGAAEERARLGPMFDDVHRGKTTVTLDLPREREKALDLVRSADVLIENFAPGTMAKLGLDAHACHAANPRLIYVSMPGFASGDNGSKDLPAYDSVIMAAVGVLRNMGLNRTLRGIEASFTDLPLPSVYASVFATLAVTCAVHGNKHGEVIEVPLASALSEALIHNTVAFPMHRCYKNLRQRCLDDHHYPVTPTRLEELLDPFFATYQCQDGRPFYLVVPSHRRHQERTLEILGVDPTILPRIDPYHACGRGVGAGGLDADQAERVRPLLCAAFLTRTAWDWQARFGRAGVPGVAHQTTREWCASDHAWKSGLLTRHGVGPLAWLTDRRTVGDPKAATPSGAPVSQNDGCLDGVRVLCLSNVIAAPQASGYLARFGAEVIKIDPVTPTYSPEITVTYGMAANVGKHSVLLDVTAPDGRVALEALVATSDVLVVNCTQACLERLRLTRDDLARLNPRMILLRFDAWSGPEEGKGELSVFNAYDDLIQAGLGIMSHFGGGLDTAEEHAQVGLIDVVSGCAAACSIVAALVLRARTGVVATARCSLAAVGQYVHYPNILGVTRSCVPGKGVERRGEHTYHRCYATKDGEWILLAACLTPSGIPLARAWVATALGYTVREMECDATVEAFDARLGAWLERNWTGKEACAQLRRAGVACVLLRSLAQVRDAHRVRAYDPKGGSLQYVVHTDHPLGSVVTMSAPVAIRMPGVPPWTPLCVPHAPKYGSTTRQVLDGVGVSSQELLRRGVASTSWSFTYMPFAAGCDGCGARGRGKVVLACAHHLCPECLHQGQLRGGICVECEAPHQLDVRVLRLAIATWATSYGNWRRGGFKGARDVHRILGQTGGRHRRSASE